MTEISPNSRRGPKEGDRRRDEQHYVRRYVKPKGRAPRWQREHRALIEEILGGPLLPDYIVHHRDRWRENNEIENLLLMPNDFLHQQLHRELERGNSRRIEELEKSCRLWQEQVRQHYLSGAQGPPPKYEDRILRPGVHASPPRARSPGYTVRKKGRVPAEPKK